MSARRANYSEPVLVPRVPNFLRTDSGATIPIEAVTDSGLRELGRLWTRALLNHAKQRRKAGRP